MLIFWVSGLGHSETQLTYTSRSREQREFTIGLDVGVAYVNNIWLGFFWDWRWPYTTTSLVLYYSFNSPAAERAGWLMERPEERWRRARGRARNRKRKVPFVQGSSAFVLIAAAPRVVFIIVEYFARLIWTIKFRNIKFINLFKKSNFSRALAQMNFHTRPRTLRMLIFT